MKKLILRNPLLRLCPTVALLMACLAVPDARGAELTGEVGANHRVLSPRTGARASGRTVALSSGLNYWHESEGWLPSEPVFDIGLNPVRL